MSHSGNIREMTAPGSVSRLSSGWTARGETRRFRSFRPPRPKRRVQPEVAGQQVSRRFGAAVLRRLVPFRERLDFERGRSPATDLSGEKIEILSKHPAEAADRRLIICKSASSLQ